MGLAYRIAVGAACVAMASLAGCMANTGVATGTTPGLAASATGQPLPGTDVDQAEEGSAGDATEQAGQQAGPQPRVAAVVAPPRAGSAVYRCGGGQSLTIDNRRTSVTLLDPDGETMLLPAAPSGQTSRYGQKPYAIVLDGNEALYVKPRKSPFTCKRG